MILRKAIKNILKPEFTVYKNGRKRPTKSSIDRLSDIHSPPTITNTSTETYVYLVEIQLGYLRDIRTDEEYNVLPAARMIYISKQGLRFTAIIKTEIDEKGNPKPVKEPKPIAVRPKKEGEKITDEPIGTYYEVLKTAHGVDPNTK